MNSIRILWEETAESLQKVYEKREAEQIAYALFEDLFGISRNAILLCEQVEVNQLDLEMSIHRLLKNEPVQYVTGRAHFYGNAFKVTTGVLIPRPETEELVDLIVKETRLVNPVIVDIGTGSGCIAISLKLNLGGRVFGTDSSDLALAIAGQNADKLGAAVTFLKNDILTEDLPVAQLDLMVSNPPYIPESDKSGMHPNVLDHEPELALFVQNDNPLVFYERIAEIGLTSLKDGGRLYFEVHERFGGEIHQLLQDKGYHGVKIHQDMQGKDRMVSCRK